MPALSTGFIKLGKDNPLQVNNGKLLCFSALFIFYIFLYLFQYLFNCSVLEP